MSHGSRGEVVGGDVVGGLVVGGGEVVGGGGFEGGGGLPDGSGDGPGAGDGPESGAAAGAGEDDGDGDDDGERAPEGVEPRGERRLPPNPLVAGGAGAAAGGGATSARSGGGGGGSVLVGATVVVGAGLGGAAVSLVESLLPLRAEASTTPRPRSTRKATTSAGTSSFRRFDQCSPNPIRRAQPCFGEAQRSRTPLGGPAACGVSNGASGVERAGSEVTAARSPRAL
jgi:hypothetical protein